MLEFHSYFHTIKCSQTLFQFVRKVRSLKLLHPRMPHNLFRSTESPNKKDRRKRADQRWPRNGLLVNSHLKKESRSGVGSSESHLGYIL